MDPCHFAGRFLPVLAVFLAAMEAFVRFSQFLEILFQKGLVLDFLSGTQGCESADACINTDCGLSFLLRGLRNINGGDLLI
jgi:hypothetical protein